jgi:hypothetical protein
MQPSSVGGQFERYVAMVSISRSMLLAASLLAFPLAGVMAQQVDTSGEGKSTGPSSASGGMKGGDAMKSGGAMKGGDAMKSATPGYQSKSGVSDGVGSSPGNAASGTSAKQQ